MRNFERGDQERDNAWTVKKRLKIFRREDCWEHKIGSTLGQIKEGNEKVK